MDKYIFLDNYKMLNKEYGIRATIVEAHDLDEAWYNWSTKWAIGNFGLLHNSSIDEVKKYFKDTIEVIEPKNILVLK